ncbi:MAG: hypothetical protein LBM65_00755, partial [Oscillospiraceae bacterium]|nr:hypothetical protein [Oscillospiraceae bacterium]
MKKTIKAFCKRARAIFLVVLLITFSSPMSFIFDAGITAHAFWEEAGEDFIDEYEDSDAYKAAEGATNYLEDEAYNKLGLGSSMLNP